MERPYDVVLFGATGFTGGLTARYLAEHAPAELRWALAGRNRTKLEAVRDDLGAAYAEVPLLVADSTDPEALRTVAESTRVLATTVGPYLTHGEPLVAACAAAGTDYLDLAGEPEFIDGVYLRHHEQAVRTGARLIHAAGFDSIPYDLGVLQTVRRLPDDVPLRVTGMIRASGIPSGGTFGSALNQMSRGSQVLKMAKQRRRVEPRPEGRRIRLRTGRLHREQGFWLVPLPVIDAQIVVRSAAALPDYGPDFSYQHYAAVKRLPMVAAGLAGVGGMMVSAQIPPLRRALTRRWDSGAGPTAERRERSWFRARFVGEGGGRRVVTEVSGGDPGYGDTAKMLGESMICLALDDLPQTAGQVTTATAMGDALTERITAAGISFQVLSEEDY